jgi:hypothetical protein
MTAGGRRASRFASNKRKPQTGAARVGEQAGPWPDARGPWLLDVNVLLALLDPLHTQHARAHAWFAGTPQRWASCALTQNGALRIMSNRSYTNPVATPGEAVELLAGLCAHPGHRYWPCDLSLLDHPTIDHGRLLSHAQLTDTYLLALALHHGGQLATFDRRLVSDAVRGGAEALHLIE